MKDGAVGLYPGPVATSAVDASVYREHPNHVGIFSTATTSATLLAQQELDLGQRSLAAAYFSYPLCPRD